MWTAYPITAFVLLVIVIIHNLLVAKHSNGQIKGLLLYQKEEPTIKVSSWTIPEEIPAWLSEAVTDFCEKSMLSGRISRQARLVAEGHELHSCRNQSAYNLKEIK